jgi:hypothetical protein
MPPTYGPSEPHRHGVPRSGDQSVRYRAMRSALSPRIASSTASELERSILRAPSSAAICLAGPHAAASSNHPRTREGRCRQPRRRGPNQLGGGHGWHPRRTGPIREQRRRCSPDRRPSLVDHDRHRAACCRVVRRHRRRPRFPHHHDGVRRFARYSPEPLEPQSHENGLLRRRSRPRLPPAGFPLVRMH